MEVFLEEGIAAVDFTRKPKLREFLTDAMAELVLKSNGEDYAGKGYGEGRKVGLLVIEAVGEDVIAESMFKADPHLLERHLTEKTGKPNAFELLTDYCEKDDFTGARELLIQLES